MKKGYSVVLKNIIGGMAVGIANIIPGVSGGTMLVIMGIFDKLLESLSDVFRVKSPNRWQAIIFIMQVLVGVVIGLVGFAKLIDWLFVDYATQTFYWFIGLVLFSISSLLKSELKDNKISYSMVIIGALLIFTIAFLSPENQELTITEFPEISLFYLFTLVGVGIIGGATMLFPGISGSLVLLILGYYYIFKSYVANVTTLQMDILLPLGFMGIGILLGILISAKLTNYFLKNKRGKTVSFILGLILASSIVLIPINISYDSFTIITSAIAFVFGAVLVRFIDRLKR